MASKGFRLGDYLKSEDVQNEHTPTEQIEYLPLDLLDPDPDNFYSLDGIDELAANIELIGLQQPLRVRPGEGGRFIVISGHRRRAACLLIRDGGSPLFDRGVPCIVERSAEANKAMQELKLIYANSATRILTSAELSKQAERVTELLYRLKEQGVSFPGRMREHVAAACRVSEAKIARVHAIRENLIPALLEKYDAGTINENVAYRLSRESPGLQWNLEQKLGAAVREISADTLDACIAQEKRAATPSVTSVRTGDSSLGEGAKDAIDGLKKYLDDKAADDKIFQTVMDRIADSLILRSFASRATGPRARLNNIDMMRIDLRNCGRGDGQYTWDGRNKGLTVQLDLGPKIERTWTEVYDALAAIAISRYRERLVTAEQDEDEDEDEERIATPVCSLARNDGDAAPAWRTGTPPREGNYAAKLRLYNRLLASPRVIWWNGESWLNSYGDDMRQHRLDRAISVDAWCLLPEE